MARSQVGELSVRGGPAGAEVVVDGRAVGTLPLSSAVKVAARNTEVVVRALGFSTYTELVLVIGGHRHEIVVNLQGIKKPAQAARVVTPTATSPLPPAPPMRTATPLVVIDEHAGDASGSGLRTAAWVVAGVAVASTGTGIALNLMARANTADYDTWQTYRRWSIVGYVGGAASALASGVLFWTSQPTGPVRKVAEAQITCVPTSNGLTCRSIF